MDWDDDELPSQLEAALQAAEAEFQRRSGGTGGGTTGAAAAAPTTERPQILQPESAAAQATGQQGAQPPALEQAPAQVGAPPVRRRRQLPTSLQGGPLPATAGSGAAGKAALGSSGGCAASSDENLPPAAFPGRIRYAFTAPEVDGLCQRLLEGGIQAAGFDIEWWVTYQTGVTPRKVALIQLCYLPLTPKPAPAGQQQQQQQRQHECLLLHIAHSGITLHLRRLLCSEAVLKVGVGVHSDALKVCRDFGFEMQGVLCLSEYANARLVGTPASAAPRDAACGSEAAAAGGAAVPSSGTAANGSRAAPGPQLLSAPQKWSLAALVSHLMRLRLEKSQGLRCSNWEVRPPLSSEQMHYAATDAWASLRCFEILSKMPVLAPPLPAAAPAAGSAPAGAMQLAAAAAAAEAAAADDDWVPACAELRHLQPAKLAVYQALQQQGLSVAQVAAQRRIQEDSVQGYMAEAMSAGLGYSWGRLGVPPAVLQHVAMVCSELLGRHFAWRPAPHRQQQQQRQEQQQQQQGEAQQACPAVGSKRPPPCSPQSLAAQAGQPNRDCTPAARPGSAAPPGTAAAAAGADGGSNRSSDGAQRGPSGGQPVDILELLLAAGHKLRELKEERFEEVSYGQLRLSLAHLGRLNPGSWGS
ncbi:hypothetical protein ABPG75_007727 [Micractinium tetrahymenae]